MKDAFHYMFIGVFGILLGIAVQNFTEPDPTTEFNNRTDYRQAAQWMARAIYSESKLYSNYEYIAWVIRNRMSSPEYPASARNVVLQDQQFSAFQDMEKRRNLLSMSYPEEKSTYFRRAYRISLYVLSVGEDMNPMPEVRHFYMQDTLERKYGKSEPHWARGKDPYFSNGQTKYFRGVRGP